MSDIVIVAVLSLIGTAIGAFAGILTANKLTNYRIEQLEHKVDKHNSLIERTYKLEEHCGIYEERFKAIDCRIKDLEVKAQ
jgi:hypothetical protein